MSNSPLDSDLQAMIDARVAEALSKQGAPSVSPEQAAASAAEVAALRDQPHPMENQALTSNPVNPDDTTVHGTAVKVSVGEPDEDDVNTVNPLPANVSNVPATSTGGTATYTPVSSDPVTGGNV